MLFDYYEILILSLIQGVSEFIPVSSSAHLYIISELFDFKNQSLMIDVGMHLGSLLAVLFYFRQDFLNILKNKQILNLMVIGSIPLIIAGFIIYTTGLIDYVRNLKLLAWLSLIFAIVLYFADKINCPVFGGTSTGLPRTVKLVPMVPSPNVLIWNVTSQG